MKNKVIFKLLFTMATSLLIFTSCEQNEISDLFNEEITSIESLKAKYNLIELDANSNISVAAKFDDLESASRYLELNSFQGISFSNVGEHLISRLKSTSIESNDTTANGTTYTSTYNETTQTATCTANNVGGNLPGMDFTATINMSGSQPQVTSMSITGVTYGVSYTYAPTDASATINGDTVEFGSTGIIKWGIEISGTNYGLSNPCNVTGTYNISTNTCTMENVGAISW